MKERNTLEGKLTGLARFLPDLRRRLAQLSIIVEGKDILLREGAGLIDAGGQRRFDFDASPTEGSAEPDDSGSVMLLSAAAGGAYWRRATRTTSVTSPWLRSRCRTPSRG